MEHKDTGNETTQTIFELATKPIFVDRSQDKEQEVSWEVSSEEETTLEDIKEESLPPREEYKEEISIESQIDSENEIETETEGKLVVEIDDRIISENVDRDIILATVVSAVYEYSARYPERWIIFSGSDEIRTRLYRIAITKNYNELCKDFHIFGLSFVDDILTRMTFDSTTAFLGFIVKRKSNL